MTAPTTSPARAPAGAAERAWSATPHPTDGRPFYSLTFRLTKYTHYKPSGRKQMGGAKGRWQERGEYGGWDNCHAPTGPWILAGHTVPDAFALALAAPDLASALRSLLALCESSLSPDSDAVRPALDAARAALAKAGPSTSDEGTKP